MDHGSSEANSMRMFWGRGRGAQRARSAAQGQPARLTPARGSDDSTPAAASPSPSPVGASGSAGRPPPSVLAVIDEEDDCHTDVGRPRRRSRRGIPAPIPATSPLASMFTVPVPVVERQRDGQYVSSGSGSSSLRASIDSTDTIALSRRSSLFPLPADDSGVSRPPSLSRSQQPQHHHRSSISRSSSNSGTGLVGDKAIGGSTSSVGGNAGSNSCSRQSGDGTLLTGGSVFGLERAALSDNELRQLLRDIQNPSGLSATSLANIQPPADPPPPQDVAPSPARRSSKRRVFEEDLIPPHPTRQVRRRDSSHKCDEDDVSVQSLVRVPSHADGAGDVASPVSPGILSRMPANKSPLPAKLLDLLRPPPDESSSNVSAHHHSMMSPTVTPLDNTGGAPSLPPPPPRERRKAVFVPPNSSQKSLFPPPVGSPGASDSGAPPPSSTTRLSTVDEATTLHMPPPGSTHAYSSSVSPTRAGSRVHHSHRTAAHPSRHPLVRSHRHRSPPTSMPPSLHGIRVERSRSTSPSVIRNLSNLSISSPNTSCSRRASLSTPSSLSSDSLSRRTSLPTTSSFPSFRTSFPLSATSSSVSSTLLRRTSQPSTSPSLSPVSSTFSLRSSPPSASSSSPHRSRSYDVVPLLPSELMNNAQLLAALSMGGGGSGASPPPFASIATTQEKTPPSSMTSSRSSLGLLNPDESSPLPPVPARPLSSPPRADHRRRGRARSRRGGTGGGSAYRDRRTLSSPPSGYRSSHSPATPTPTPVDKRAPTASPNADVTDVVAAATKAVKLEEEHLRALVDVVEGPSGGAPSLLESAAAGAAGPSSEKATCSRGAGANPHAQRRAPSRTAKRHYACPVCAKAFDRQSRLKTHMLSHTNEKPWSCDQCHKCYRYSWGLKRHRLQRHDTSDSSDGSERDDDHAGAGMRGRHRVSGDDTDMSPPTRRQALPAPSSAPSSPAPTGSPHDQSESAPLSQPESEQRRSLSSLLLSSGAYPSLFSSESSLRRPGKS